jgi:hypothetical protein
LRTIAKQPEAARPAGRRGRRRAGVQAQAFLILVVLRVRTPG